jgi:hypothetical protein
MLAGMFTGARIRLSGVALGAAVIALGVAACGGSGSGTTTSSHAGALTGTGSSTGSTTAPATRTVTTTGSGSAGTVVSAIAAVNANVPLRSAAAAAYAEGMTGCAIRAASTPSGAIELDIWSPARRLPGMSWTFSVAGGTVSGTITHAPRSAAWRPPGGPNCTIGPGGVVIAM